MRVPLMVRAIPDVLARIVDSKRDGLPFLRASRDSLEERAAARTSFRDFRTALTASRSAGLSEKTPAIIAEIKKASPSKGVLAERFDPAAIARAYASGGAAALSVLTDAEFFQGTLDDLEAARAAVAVPVLRKDFTIDEFHVIEAAAHGADAILLIAALLDESRLARSSRNRPRAIGWPRWWRSTMQPNSMRRSAPARRSSASTIAICIRSR